MSEQAPSAPPQYSPDGRWWWNGQDWVPIAPPPPPDQLPIQMPTSVTKPGFWNADISGPARGTLAVIGVLVVLFMVLGLISAAVHQH